MKSILRIIMLTILVGAITSCISNPTKQETNQTSTSNPIVEVLELDTYLNQLSNEKRMHHFVDVRTPEEVAEGTIGEAINIDYNAEDFIDKFKSLDKTQPVYLFCRSGNRSGKATKLLLEEGFTEIYDLKGGYLEYSEEK